MKRMKTVTVVRNFDGLRITINNLTSSNHTAVHTLNYGVLLRGIFEMFDGATNNIVLERELANYIVRFGHAFIVVTHQQGLTVALKMTTTKRTRRVWQNLRAFLEREGYISTFIATQKNRLQFRVCQLLKRPNRVDSIRKSFLLTGGSLETNPFCPSLPSRHSFCCCGLRAPSSYYRTTLGLSNVFSHCRYRRKRIFSKRL